MRSRYSNHQICIGSINFLFHSLLLYISRSQGIQPQANFGVFLWKGWKTCGWGFCMYLTLSLKSYLLFVSNSSVKVIHYASNPVLKYLKMWYYTWQGPNNVKNEKCPGMHSIRSQWYPVCPSSCFVPLDLFQICHPSPLEVSVLIHPTFGFCCSGMYYAGKSQDQRWP